MAGSSSQAISIVSIAGDTVADINLSDPWFADHVGHLGESNSVTTISVSVLKKHLQDLIGIPYYTQQLCLDEEVDVVQDDFDIQPPAKFTLVRLPYVEDNSASERLRGAAGGGDAQAVLRELLSPSHPDGGVDDVTTALCLASEAGHLEIVLLLHAAGADKDKVSLQDGLTPLFFASEAGHLEIVRLLVSAGADKDKATPPLYAASEAGHLEIVRFLVSAGADKDKATLQDGFTPLYTASQAGHLEIVRFLFSAGADKNKATLQHGCTPLFAASEAGHLEIVSFLVRAGADKDKATLQDGHTPLFAASRAGHLEIVRFLVSAGADKDKATLLDGLTPLYTASRAGHLEIVRFLVSTGRVSRLRVGARRVPIWK